MSMTPGDHPNNSNPSSPLGGITDEEVKDALDGSTIAWALSQAGVRPEQGAKQDQKKNYAERLSRALATLIATTLSETFVGVLPTSDGKGQESKARTGKGYKKLDVQYSTPELGMALGVSIKTVVAADPSSGRLTKNFTRIDNELRAETSDYHQRQPYAVMVAVIFLPIEACFDGKNRTPSSFGKAIQTFRSRTGRESPHHDVQLFEEVYVGLWEVDGRVTFFDAKKAPPRQGRPSRTLSLRQLVDAITEAYDVRNSVTFRWEEEPTEGIGYMSE